MVAGQRALLRSACHVPGPMGRTDLPQRALQVPAALDRYTVPSATRGSLEEQSPFLEKKKISR